MKNLYHKNKDKGKVYPSPSLSSSSSSSSTSSPSNNNKDVLNLLPAAILVLVSVLSLEDREVLSYLITMSLKSTNPSSSSPKILIQKFKKTSHKPLFDCGCFDCYTSFWFRWDSSPNRELIHQAIEAFEEHLSKRDDELILSSSSPSSKHRGKKKDKMGRSNSDKSVNKHQKKKVEKTDIIIPALPEFEPEKKPLVTKSEDIVVLSECVNEDEEKKRNQVSEERKDKEEVKEEHETVVEEVVEEAEEQVQVLNNGGHRGLARKVLPDVLGILNSRLWSLWSPNV
ncbi:hypothetical protein MKX01_025791 [Papaver californicum]|nr:hypothetical protein MKX01_025791 [Papaver californicum]